MKRYYLIVAGAIALLVIGAIVVFAVRKREHFTPDSCMTDCQSECRSVCMNAHPEAARAYDLGDNPIAKLTIADCMEACENQCRIKCRKGSTCTSACK